MAGLVVWVPPTQRPFQNLSGHSCRHKVLGQFVNHESSKMNQEVEPVQQSFLNWMMAALGFNYAILLALAALAAFVLASIIVVRGRGPMAGVALVFIVPVPMLIGIFAAIQGAMSTYIVIATSGATPKPSELATGISMALVAPLAGMLLMVPSFAVAAIGCFVRALLDRPDSGPASGAP